jgi:hypothetical protein
MLDLILAAALAQANAPTDAAPPPPGPCLALDAATAPAGCPAWRLMLEGGGARIFIDPASVRRDGDRFEILFRGIFAEPVDGARSVVMWQSFDCGARTVTTRRLVFYSAAGVPVSGHVMTSAELQAEPVTAGSSFERVRAEFCQAAR